MATIQQQARALGDPTRNGVFCLVVDAGRPVDVAELTAHFQLNHNAIRQHLAKLIAAELVVQGTAPQQGRGRPRLEFSVAPAAESRWGAVGSYERLSLLLSEVIRTGDAPVEVGRRAGRRHLARTVDDPVEHLRAEMARHGFDPVAEVRDGRVDLTLRTCPFATTALVDPETVCDLHLGLAHGMAEAAGGGLVVEELLARDPRQAGCRLRCRVDLSVGEPAS